MIKPLLQHHALLADIAAAPTGPDEFSLWWLGQSGFLVKWAERQLLFDPYLSDSLTQKYAATDKPHVRMTELPIDPAKFGGITVVTSSHNHTDHLDADTLIPLIRANPQVHMVIPEANRAFVAARLSCDPGWPLGLNAGQSATVAGFEFHGVPAAHEKLSFDAQGRHHFMGYVVKFGPWSIYHSGDTIPFDGMADILRPFAVDLALLPINGRKPERRVDGNLWGREAAQLATNIGARLVIPCHYDLFQFNTETPDEFVAQCRQLGQAYRVLQCAERFSSREITR
jgi:L-ascorbate metabolism protein UlaG (beta-lactamase superfamily)